MYAPAAVPEWNPAANAVGNFLDKVPHLGVIILQSGEGVRP